MRFPFSTRVMTKKQQLRQYNLEKADESLAAKVAQKEELVKAVSSEYGFINYVKYAMPFVNYSNLWGFTLIKFNKQSLFFRRLFR